MFVITGITGKVGGIAARTLLDRGQRVRAVVRDRLKAKAWLERGCEVVEVPAMDDAAALTGAFAEADGVFLLNPPNYDPAPGFPDTHSVARAFSEALEEARPTHAVFLSSIGAQVPDFNLLNNAGLVEAALRSSSVPVTMLRPAWFMENATGDVGAARLGEIRSYLQPLDRRLPMVSVRDIGRIVADLLMETPTTSRVVELEGPERCSPDDLAAMFSKVLTQDVLVSAIPTEDWEAMFRAEGMHYPLARIKMLEGLSQGWLDFDSPSGHRRFGDTKLETVVRGLIESAP
jgi:NAD(P)H dehydrogenase (quinone)